MVNFDKESQKVTIWENSFGDCYVFFPGGIDISNAYFELNTQNSLSIDEVQLTNGMTCEAFELNVPYKLKQTDWGKEKTKNITFIQPNGVATMFISTQSGNMEYIHSEKGNKESGEICLLNNDGTLNYSGNIESINGRGNSTWSADKKPYSITLSQEGNLLGMGDAKEWILLANAYDESGLRNKIVYDFSNTIGLQYSPDSQWVNLYLNGEYVGLYLLSERNEVHSNRVDIKDDAFLVSIEHSSRLEPQGTPYITTQADLDLQIRYPLNPSSETLTNIRQIWQSAENAILSEDGIDPVSGKSWLELIDLDSWATKYLMEEVFGSLDACSLSQYFYLDNSGKISAGPVWDFDYSMGSSNVWQMTNPNCLRVDCYDKNGNSYTPWFYSLYHKEEFYNRVIEIYEEIFLPELEILFENNLPNYIKQISQSDKANRIRWEIEDELSIETQYIKDFMLKRIDFLTDMWGYGKDYCFVKIDISSYTTGGYFAVPTGGHLSGLSEFKNSSEGNLYGTYIGWYYEGTDIPFDESQPITEDIEIYVKREPRVQAETPTGIFTFETFVAIFSIAFVVVLVIGFIRIKKERVTKNVRE